MSAGGSDKRVETKPEAPGACECSAANEAAEHVAVALRMSVELCCVPIAVRALQGLGQGVGVMLEPH